MAQENNFNVLIISPTWDSWPSNDKLMRELYPNFTIVAKENDPQVQEWIAKAISKNPEEIRPCVIFMDYYLCDRSVFHVIKDIRSDSQLDHVYIVTMSVLKDEYQNKRCLEAGVLDCILLPLTPSKMEMVKQHVLKVDSKKKKTGNSQNSSTSSKK